MQTPLPLADPARIIWLKRLPREGFRQLVSLCDVLLDPTHFGGGHTSYEAFCYGVPVVTLPSPYLRGRLTLSMLQQMGLEAELAVDSVARYIERAVELASDRTGRQCLSEQLKQRCGSLFDSERAVRSLTEALRSATNPI